MVDTDEERAERDGLMNVTAVETVRESQSQRVGVRVDSCWLITREQMRREARVKTRGTSEGDGPSAKRDGTTAKAAVVDVGCEVRTRCNLFSIVSTWLWTSRIKWTRRF